MTDRDSVYNDPAYDAYDITSVPAWKTPPGPPLHGKFSPAAKLSPRAKAAVGAGAVVLAATGMVAWSNYESAQAKAEVQRAQISLQQSQLDLERQKQSAAESQQASQETPAQKARREAVEACVAKAGGAFNAISDCGKAFPAVDSSGMVNTAQTVTGKGDSGSNSGVGLIVLGAVGAAFGVGWVKKKYASL